MSNTPTKAIAANDSYLGYVLKERIGAGGYGEVWSAEAPGGMLKAAKIIYGFHDENRAQRELKAIDRIKQVRHPFLLSLERIDVIDGRMVVITELADMCLKQRFNQCREQGADGIEREELLGYMREAADALDYIADNYSLAHLDIKPENLLLLGDHVKVADFGLVKDIQQQNQSLMDGLTPAYAAPELFDGQPGRASDQYSLAIVYQEMLTSTRPFSGTTAAQLASQHMHSRPNLNSLPRSDQAVIARALSKEPEKRFANCRTLIDELSKRKSRVRAKVATGPKAPIKPVNTSDETNPRMNIRAVKPDQTMTISESFIPAIKFDGAVEKLEPWVLEDVTPAVRPTLFVGVGHTGTKALCRLRRRLSNRYGDPEGIPAIRLLCLDVDRRALFDATLGHESESLSNHEILNIPLRKPEDYRNDTQIDTSWIGRRWIYNIPKSQLTESLRPLGRLAYVDHHEKIYQRLHDELEKISSPEALATTAETIGLSPADTTPQVFIVGSISGGTGSGMILDLAYSIRVCMGELGLSDDHVYGFLSHSTSRTAGDNRLSIANTYSFLNEFYHYNLNGFPGSPYCTIPAFDENTPAFNSLYLLHLGNALQDEEYDSAMDAMGEYLYLSTTTKCNGFFEKCRRNEDEYDSNLLRTMGISFVSRGHSSLTDLPSQTIAAHMIKRWLHGEEGKPDRRFDTHAFVEQLIDESPIGPKQLNSQFDQLVVDDLGDNPVSELLRMINEQVSQVDDPAKMLSVTANLLDRKLGQPGGCDMDSSDPDHTLYDLIESKLPRTARRIRDQLAEKIFDLLNEPAARLFGAKSAAKAMDEALQVLAVSTEPVKLKLQQDLEDCRARFDQIFAAKPSQRINTENKCLQIVAEFTDMRLKLVKETFKRRLVSIVRSELSMTLGALTEMTQKLDLVNQQLNLALEVKPVECRGDFEEDENRDLRSIMVQKYVDQVETLMQKLEDAIEQKYLAEDGGLLKILGEGTHRLRKLPDLIRCEAQNIVCEAMQELRIDTIIRDSKFSAPEIASWLNQLVEAAHPKLYECGGTSRLLLAVPEKAPVTSIAGFIQNQFDHEANVIPATCGELVICYEMDAIPVENAAMSILQMQPDCAELIGRLHIRNDVDWTSLTPLC